MALHHLTPRNTWGALKSLSYSWLEGPIWVSGDQFGLRIIEPVLLSMDASPPAPLPLQDFAQHVYALLSDVPLRRHAPH